MAPQRVKGPDRGPSLIVKAVASCSSEPVLIEVAGEGEAGRMAAVFARLLVTGFAAKVMIRIEGHGFDHSVELGQQQVEYSPSGVV